MKEQLSIWDILQEPVSAPKPSRPEPWRAALDAARNILAPMLTGERVAPRNGKAAIVPGDNVLELQLWRGGRFQRVQPVRLELEYSVEGGLYRELLQNVNFIPLGEWERKAAYMTAFDGAVPGLDAATMADIRECLAPALDGGEILVETAPGHFERARGCGVRFYYCLEDELSYGIMRLDRINFRAAAEQSRSA